MEVPKFVVELVKFMTELIKSAMEVPLSMAELVKSVTSLMTDAPSLIRNVTEKPFSVTTLARSVTEFTKTGTGLVSKRDQVPMAGKFTSPMIFGGMALSFWFNRVESQIRRYNPRKTYGILADAKIIHCAASLSE
jgi:hypothetical protein